MTARRAQRRQGLFGQWASCRAGPRHVENLDERGTRNGERGTIRKFRVPRSAFRVHKDHQVRRLDVAVDKTLLRRVLQTERVWRTKSHAWAIGRGPWRSTSCCKVMPGTYSIAR